MKLSKLDRNIESFKKKEQKEIDKLKQGQYDLEEESNEVTTQKEKLTQQLKNMRELPVVT